MTIWALLRPGGGRTYLARQAPVTLIFPLDIQQGVLDKGEMLMTGIPGLFRLPGKDSRYQF